MKTTPAAPRTSGTDRDSMLCHNCQDVFCASVPKFHLHSAREVMKPAAIGFRRLRLSAYAFQAAAVRTGMMRVTAATVA